MSTVTMAPAIGARAALVQAAQGRPAPAQQVPADIRVITGPGTPAAASSPQPADSARSVEALLSMAGASESARTRQLAEKISGLVAELTGRVEAEEKQRRERKATEEQRRKLAEAEAVLARQLAEVRQKLRATGRESAASPSRDRKGAGQRAVIRKWAAANGYEVRERGRIPREVVRAWAAATGSEVPR